MGLFRESRMYAFLINIPIKLIPCSNCLLFLLGGGVLGGRGRIGWESIQAVGAGGQSFVVVLIGIGSSYERYR